MRYRLAVDLGSTFVTAATAADDGETELVILGLRGARAASLIHIGTDGALLYGDAAADRAVTEPDRVVRALVRHIGDETPLVPGTPTDTRAHVLAAGLIAWVVGMVTITQGARPAAVAVTHPAAWGPHKQNLLLGALRSVGIVNAVLIPEPVAAAHIANPTGGATVVYDLGGRTFDLAVLAPDATGRPAVLGRPACLPDLGGTDFDDAVLAHVLGALDPRARRALDAALEAPGGPDAAIVAAMAQLRTECVAAKEALSAGTDATILIEIADVVTTVRLTRAEFEEAIATAVESTLDLTDAVLAEAGIAPEQVTQVVLSGGSTQVPLITQLLSAHFGGRLHSCPDPSLAVVTGALHSLQAPAARPAGPIPAPAPAARVLVNAGALRSEAPAPRPLQRVAAQAQAVDVPIPRVVVAVDPAEGDTGIAVDVARPVRRRRRPLVYAGRVLTLSLLTAAILAGSSAWVPAGPTFAESPVVASAPEKTSEQLSEAELRKILKKVLKDDGSAAR
ncbi:MAG: Hsp70 family protein [Sporichthyaceae bacterium]